jgi:hypothetical protein
MENTTIPSEPSAKRLKIHSNNMANYSRGDIVSISNLIREDYGL